MTAHSTQSWLIHPACLADGLSASSQAGCSVLVHDGRIAAVGPRQQLEQQTPPQVERLELGHACLTPGLIDVHTHLSLAADGRSYAQLFAESDEMMTLAGVRSLRQHLEAGITTLRDLGARNQVGFALKEGLRRGYFPGPRLLACGRSITCTAGHFHMCNEIADGEEEMRRAIRRLVHQGADFIKLMASGGGTVGTIPGRASYSPAELRAAVDEARHFGRLTAAHCRATQAMWRAVEAGIDLLEHAEFLDPDNQLRFDPKLADKMAGNHTWISPTLQARTGYRRLIALEERQRQGIASPAEEQERERLEAHTQTLFGMVRRLFDHGLKERLLPGTDSGVGTLTFGHLDYELQLLVRAGFTPGEALQAATRFSAEAIGLSAEIGTIEPGKLADLAAFGGDPTRDVAAFSQVEAVFQNGRRVR